jgi:hypothetical protein
MTLLHFLQAPVGRLVRVALGLAAVVYGATHPSLTAIVAMMTGAVFIVTGVAGAPARPAPPKQPAERAAS